ncbi:MAG: T9SS type A sorting domain-containing protein [Ferruginibacter sp.]
MKSFLLSASLVFGLFSSAQTVDIDNTGGQASLIGLGAVNYHASESIYTDAEIGSGNFTTVAGSIEKISFKVTQLGTPTTFNNVSIYFKNVPSSTTSFTTGTYSTAGYTLVFSGPVTLSALGFTNTITLTTPFVRNAGDNLQMLVERADNSTHTGFIYQTSNGNSINISLPTTRRYNGTVALSGTTSLAASAFRPALRLIREYTTDIAVQEVYTLSKLPIPNSTPHFITAQIKNFGSSTVTNLNVTLDITGANTFSNTQVIPSLAPGASQLVSFAAFSPSIEGLNIVNVSVPTDDFPQNDSKSQNQVVNENTWSYIKDGENFGTTTGSSSTIDYAAKFTTSNATSLTQVRLHIFANPGRLYKIAFWTATGAGGSPGTLIWESPVNLTTFLGYNLVVLPTPVPIPAGSFYAGVRQVTTNSNIGLSFQYENPLRTGTFYYTIPSGGTWVDMSGSFTTRYRLAIEPSHILAVNAATTNISGAAATANCTKTINVTVANAGSNPIAAGAASVTLKVAGANNYLATLSNTGIINAGSSEVISFTGISTPNMGTNVDTAFVTLLGDADQLNDTLSSSFTTAITAALNAAPNNGINLVKNCEDNGWTYYSDPANFNTSLFAVQWDPTSTGQNSAAKANAVPKLQLDGTYFSAEDIPAKKATYTMRRYWNVDLAGNPLTGPVNLRFFYDAADKTAVENAATTFASTNAGTLEPFSWFQLNAPSFVGDAAHVTPDFVLNSYPIFNSNTANNTINGILYAQFDGLTNLVGGTYATGVGPSTPLPLNLLSFEARQAGRQHLLSWKTANEVNISKFIIERSSNGTQFGPIGEVNATGLNQYSFTDAAVLKGNNFYRLKIMELNGNYKLSEVKLLHAGTTGISLFPNPIKDKALLELDAVNSGKVEIQVLDVTGKTIKTYRTQIQPGINRLPIDMNELAPGSYILKIQGDDFVEMLRAVKM